MTLLSVPSLGLNDALSTSQRMDQPLAISLRGEDLTGSLTNVKTGSAPLQPRAQKQGDSLTLNMEESTCLENRTPVKVVLGSLGVIAGCVVAATIFILKAAFVLACAAAVIVGIASTLILGSALYIFFRTGNPSRA